VIALDDAICVRFVMPCSQVKEVMKRWKEVGLEMFWKGVGEKKS